MEIDGKMFIFRVNPGMWPLKSIVSEKKDIAGKSSIFQLNLGMWPLKSIVLEKWALFWGSEHTFMGCYGDRWENIRF